jgi:hypothetical protein
MDELARYVQVATEDARNCEEQLAAARRILSFSYLQDQCSYDIPKLIATIDPAAVLFPDLIAERIAAANDSEYYAYSRIASVYPLGSPAWRVIARPVLERADREFDEEKKRSRYASLEEPWSRFGSGPAGVVPDACFDAVRRAKQLLDGETDPLFKPYWEYKLRNEEASLRFEEEHVRRYKEEESDL